MIKTVFFVLIGISLALSQSISVIDRIQLTDQKEGKFYFPLFSPDNTKILLTSAQYRGLWYLDLNTNSILQLNNDDGAGYKPVFTSNGKMIFFKKNIFIAGRKYSSIHAFDILTGEERLIQPESRELLQMGVVENNLIYRLDRTIHQINTKNLNKTTYSGFAAAIVFKDRDGLVVETANGSHKIDPIGHGHYIWSSLSPDKKKILFTVAGRGTFITDLYGDSRVDLGRAHAPKWSADGEWIVYMDDRDDGERYISSTISVVKSDGSERFNLTTGEYLAMYPDWSSDGKRIVYHTLEGEIHLLQLSYGEDNR